MKIVKKIKISKLNKIKTKNGNVMHALKKNEGSFLGFGEAYFSFVNYGKIKGWKKHKKMTCNLIVPLGSVKFVILDDKKKLKKKIVIGENNYCRLTIPNNHWFAFKGLSKNKNIILNISNIPHVKDEVEEIIDKRLFNLYF